MHEPALARAALPAPVVCLGMLLRPYSLGHELWLIRESNAALRGSIDGLPAAVLICSQDWDELRRMRSDHFLGLKLWIWECRMKRKEGDFLRGLSRIFANKKSALIRGNSRKALLEKELATFLAYRAEGLLELPISQVARSDRAMPRLPGCPFILRLQQWLMTHFHLTESAAWDYPVGLAKMRWAAHWEQEGGLDIYNAHEAESDAQIEYWESLGGPSAMKLKEAQCQV